MVQIAAIALMTVPHFTGAHARAFDPIGIAYLPAMLLGCTFGIGFFRWMTDRQFALGVNSMLLVSGLSLLT